MRVVLSRADARPVRCAAATAGPVGLRRTSASAARALARARATSSSPSLRVTRALCAAAHELDAAATSCSSAGWRLTGAGSPGGSLARDDACLMTGIHDGLGTLTEGELEVARARARALAALAEVRRSPTGPAVAAAHLTGLASALLSTTRIYAEADGAARCSS